MTFFPYWFILILALTIHIIKSSSISSSDDGPVSNRSNIALSEHSSKRFSTYYKDRIVGGQYVKDFRKYPFIVYVYIKKIHNYIITSEFCGGTLLSTTHVLTAAHCINECDCNEGIDDSNCPNCTSYGVEDYTLYFGSIVPANSKVSRKLKNFFVHPEFKHQDLINNCRHRFDIAVLELRKPVRYSRTISNINLPDPVALDKDHLISRMTSSFFDTNKKCIILGWGDIASEDTRDFKTRPLKVGAVPLIGLDMCKYLLSGRYLCTDTTICSKCPNDRTSTCFGDSGGPIICGGVQVGVASYGLGKCGTRNVANMYTRVNINVQWIRDIMANKYYRTLHEY